MEELFGPPYPYLKDRGMQRPAPQIAIAVRDYSNTVKERKDTEMTILVPSFDDAIVVREADAEVLGLAQLSTRLLADSDATIKTP
jgi:hypothetical protein